MKLFDDLNLEQKISLKQMMTHVVRITPIVKLNLNLNLNLKLVKEIIRFIGDGVLAGARQADEKINK